MALILNIETATKNCSVSLADEGEVVALKEYAGEGYLHAEKLHDPRCHEQAACHELP